MQVRGCGTRNGGARSFVEHGYCRCRAKGGIGGLAGTNRPHNREARPANKSRAVPRTGVGPKLASTMARVLNRIF